LTGAARRPSCENKLTLLFARGKNRTTEKQNNRITSRIIDPVPAQRSSKVVFIFPVISRQHSFFSDIPSGQRLPAHTPLTAIGRQLFFEPKNPATKKASRRPINPVRPQCGIAKVLIPVVSRQHRFPFISIVRPRQQSAFQHPSIPTSIYPASSASPFKAHSSPHSTFCPQHFLLCSLLSETLQKIQTPQRGERKKTVAKPGQPREKRKRQKITIKEERGKGIKSAKYRGKPNPSKTEQSLANERSGAALN
jgi:hypothetical protein